MAPQASADARCPVLVVTGGLGSGKTTLVRHWLEQEVLADCAVIVNEIGEVPFDSERLGVDVTAAGVIAQQCVCCSGLPDLRETLERFFWDRLHRRMRCFDRVVIETTGAADPEPVVELLAGHPFLRDKFRLEAVLTTVSGVAHWPEAQDSFARRQIALANTLVITKCDRITPPVEQALRESLATLVPAVPVTVSGVQTMPDLAPLIREATALGAAHRQDTAAAAQAWAGRPLHRPAGPAVHTWFDPMVSPMALEDMRHLAATWVAQAASLQLLRLKGLWRCKAPLGGDHPWEVQWVRGDEFARIGPVDLPARPLRWGITFIAKASYSP